MLVKFVTNLTFSPYILEFSPYIFDFSPYVFRIYTPYLEVEIYKLPPYVAASTRGNGGNFLYFKV